MIIIMLAKGDKLFSVKYTITLKFVYLFELFLQFNIP